MGLSLQAAYTWSRSFTTGASTTTATATTLNSNDPNNAAQQYGLSGGYYPQRLAVNYSWDLPFGHPDGFKGQAGEWLEPVWRDDPSRMGAPDHHRHARRIDLRQRFHLSC